MIIQPQTSRADSICFNIIIPAKALTTDSRLMMSEAAVGLRCFCPTI